MIGLTRRVLEVAYDEQQPVFGRRKRAIRVDREAARRAGLPRHRPLLHMRLERGFKRWDDRRKLLQREAGQLAHLVCWIGQFGVAQHRSLLSCSTPDSLSQISIRSTVWRLPLEQIRVG